ncbi:MAG: phytochelatin synthase [Myxococcaceae bacterium]|nr:phytochelatin synthase [Myxococcaceae bacterium]
MKRALIAAVGLSLCGAAAAFVFVRTGAPPQWDVATRDPARVEQGWAATAAHYPRPLLSQSNPMGCGPTSLANVWRSADAGAFESPCALGICFGGLTLDELAKAAEHPGWKVTALRGLSLEQLREELRHVADPGRRYVANFHRRPIFGTGGGHHSPIGAVLGDDVFVLDVNESYGPWLVSLPKLFEAMSTVDAASGQQRGLLRIELR